jgi:large subunit ribosomal protein L21
MATYVIIAVGGKQYRVQEGERLLVDRVATDEGKTFNPSVLLFGDDKKTELSPSGVSVTARVVSHVRGEKVTIGKYRPKSGYRRKTGFRAALSQLEIEKIGGRGAAAKAEPKAEPKAQAKPKAEPKAAPRRQPAKAAAEEQPAGMPKGYREMTVAEIAGAAPGWRRPMLQAALEYERAHAARKGAIAALESTLAAKEDK